MKFKFDGAKSTKLFAERDIGFDEIITAITEGNLLASEYHHNPEKYPNQKVFYVLLRDEIYSVPYITEQDGTIFLKTAFANRKARKRFLGK